MNEFKWIICLKMDGTLFAAKQMTLIMAKITIKFLAAHIEDDEVDLFIKKMEEILKRFAGQAFHFRYDIEKPQFDEEFKGRKP
jgi:hypothetical protein